MPTISKTEAIRRGYAQQNIQTILFNKDTWNKRTATTWLKLHNYKFDNHRTTVNQHRFMQNQPVKNASYFTHTLPNGIQIVFQTLPK